MNKKSFTMTSNRYIEVGERPWGKYYVLEEMEGFKVKKIEVEPGHRLSLQSHKSRSEHWIVSQGVATVTLQEPSREEAPSIETYQVGQNCFIPSEYLHRLANLGDQKLIIIEVQIGDYLGEDDIIRYEDDYQRKGDK